MWKSEFRSESQGSRLKLVTLGLTVTWFYLSFINMNTFGVGNSDQTAHKQIIDNMDVSEPTSESDSLVDIR